MMMQGAGEPRLWPYQPGKTMAGWPHICHAEASLPVEQLVVVAVVVAAAAVVVVVVVIVVGVVIAIVFKQFTVAISQQVRQSNRELNFRTDSTRTVRTERSEPNRANRIVGKI